MVHRPLDAIFNGGSALTALSKAFPPTVTGKRGAKRGPAEEEWAYDAKSDTAEVSPFVLAAESAVTGSMRSVLSVDLNDVSGASSNFIQNSEFCTLARSSSAAPSVYARGVGGWAEWEIVMPVTVGAVSIAIQYNACVSSPLVLSLNGAVVDRNIATELSGSLSSKSTLMWLAAPCGPFALRSGRTKLRLETKEAGGKFPAIAQIVLHWSDDDSLATERADSSKISSLVVVGGAASLAKRFYARRYAPEEGGAAAAGATGSSVQEVSATVRSYFDAASGDVGCAPASADAVAYPGTAVESSQTALAPLLREHLVLTHFISSAALSGPGTITLPAHYGGGGE